MDDVHAMVSGNLALSVPSVPARRPLTQGTAAPHRFSVVSGARARKAVASDHQLWAPDVYAAGCAKMTGTASRVRAIAAGIVLFMALAIGLTVSTVGRAACVEAALATAHRVEITVAEGDSLWSIASEHPIAGLETAQTVETMRSWNKLDSALLRAGAALIVPA